ncbi:MAG TPA: GNAT family N-acetyltransferase [Ilumatobacteraceae bacterium]
MPLPEPYVARPYRGPSDHAAMVSILIEYREHAGTSERPTVEQFGVTYANLTNCDPATDIAVVETTAGEPVGYARTSWEDIEGGGRDCILFGPVRPAHLAEPLILAMVAAQEAHLRPTAGDHAPARFRAYAPHPGPGLEATEESAWLESAGYRPIRFEASLVRPNLDDIPDLSLPDGVEVRPVTPEMVRPIWEAHYEAFRGAWDFHEATEAEIQELLDDPLRDESLWKIAWSGDTIVGQVKSFINAEENTERGYRRGYTEYISTHAEWRNRGIASALLAMSLRELASRGMTEAALGADTQNPGGAFHVYTGMGFELRAYEAIYAKPLA